MNKDDLFYSQKQNMNKIEKKRIKENIPMNKYIYTQVLIEHNINQNLHSTNVLF